MNDFEKSLGVLPAKLRKSLIAEYRKIAQNFLERHWSPSELSGGRFCEIVFSILQGHAKGTYPTVAKKPSNFVASCRKLENETTLPRSFRILIPRLLPAIYEVRNNRGVGHVGGDVDPNFMDSTFVLSSCSWIMAEIVRVIHSISLEEASRLVTGLSEYRTPIVWVAGDIRRVLKPEMKLQEQILVLLGSSTTPVNIDQLSGWLEYPNSGYVKRVVNSLHKNRLIEGKSQDIQLLPPGHALVASIIARHGET